MILQARTENDKFLIAMYETEKPKLEDFKHKGRDKTVSFNIAMIDWQSSKREHEVRESDKEEILDLIWDAYKSKYPADLYLEEIETGIDCTFLKDRLELKSRRSIKEKEHVFEWTLKPIQEEKEEAVEFGEWLRKNCTAVSILKIGDPETKLWTLDSEAKYSWSLDDQKKYTTKELYQIFKNPNKQE